MPSRRCSKLKAKQPSAYLEALDKEENEPPLFYVFSIISRH